jgi:hypothetical protein
MGIQMWSIVCADYPFYIASANWSKRKLRPTSTWSLCRAGGFVLTPKSLQIQVDGLWAIVICAIRGPETAILDTCTACKRTLVSRVASMST